MTKSEKNTMKAIIEEMKEDQKKYPAMKKEIQKDIDRIKKQI